MGEKLKIGILGSGAWGTALACLLARNKHGVQLWGRDSDLCNEISTRHTNEKYLPGIELDKKIVAVENIEDAIAGSQCLLLVTPAQTAGELAKKITKLIPENLALVMCAKGIDSETLLLPSDRVKEIIPQASISALSGPSFATDVARGLPTAVTLASGSLEEASRLAKNLSGDRFRIYASDDLRGVEIGGSLKNIIAIAVGVSRGMKLGASAEAALITRGFAEIVRLATAMGGRKETIFGLSGLGDLTLTCSSVQSRNFSYGVAIGSGKGVKGLPLAEGAKSVFVAHKIAEMKNISCPIISITKLIIEGKVEPQETEALLLGRPLKAEGF
ncbi:MAG: NAD(P)H-dependent glycerol-3-phosphate dehydrogenase [Rhizobiaceae bacterium]